MQAILGTGDRYSRSEFSKEYGVRSKRKCFQYFQRR